MFAAAAVLGFVPVASAGGYRPDLAITMTQPKSVVAEQNLTYSIVVRNVGRAVATKVEVHDAPVTVNFVDASASQGYCGVPDAIACSLGTLRPGHVARVTIVVSPLVTGRLNNTVSTQARQAESTYANNWTTHSVTVKSRFVDIGVRVKESRDPVRVNQDLGYTITVTNSGPWSANDVSVEFALLHPYLPGNVLYDAFSPSRGTCDGPTEADDPVTGAAIPVHCQIGDLAVGERVTITIEGRPTWPTGTQHLNALAYVVGSYEPDRNPRNDYAQAFTTVTSGNALVDCGTTDPPVVSAQAGRCIP